MKPPEKTVIKSSKDVPGMVFPCNINVKIFINNNADIEQTLRQFILAHLEQKQLNSWASRESSGGKFLAITASIDTPDREHIDAFYQALYDNEHVIMII